MGESQVFGPDVLRDAEEQVRMIRDNQKVVQSHRKAMQILGEGNWSFKWEIMCILKCHQ